MNFLTLYMMQKKPSPTFSISIMMGTSSSDERQQLGKVDFL